MARKSGPYERLNERQNRQAKTRKGQAFSKQTVRDNPTKQKSGNQKKGQNQNIKHNKNAQLVNTQDVTNS